MIVVFVRFLSLLVGAYEKKFAGKELARVRDRDKDRDKVHGRQQIIDEIIEEEEEKIEKQKFSRW